MAGVLELAFRLRAVATKRQVCGDSGTADLQKGIVHSLPGGSFEHPKKQRKKSLITASYELISWFYEIKSFFLTNPLWHNNF